VRGSLTPPSGRDAPPQRPSRVSARIFVGSLSPRRGVEVAYYGAPLTGSKGFSRPPHGEGGAKIPSSASELASLVASLGSLAESDP